MCMVTERRTPNSALTTGPRSGRACGANGLERLPWVHEPQPAMPVGRLAVDDGEERFLDGLGDRAATAATDRDLVHRSDRRDLGCGADEERLVRNVEELAGKRLLGNLETEVARDLQNRVASDARQHGGRKRRRVEHFVADEEQV